MYNLTNLNFRIWVTFHAAEKTSISLKILNAYASALEIRRGGPKNQFDKIQSDLCNFHSLAICG